MKQHETASQAERVTCDLSVLPTFKPSDVRFGGFPPFVGTFRKTEAEMAAALLVRTMQAPGDEWRAVSLPEVGARLKEDVDAEREPWKSLSTNPFFRPDFGSLVSDGFCEWKSGGDAPITDPQRLLAFTPSGIEALRRWVRPQRAAVQP